VNKRALIAKLKRIASHDDQMQTIREISALIDELSAAAAGCTHQAPESLADVLAADMRATA